ncbi:hypothetical protein ABVK25_011475 [Lepraria finkii]|uniref:V-type proton ATPase catalytic subunit A n=1 Tax=Lepraria finkii TaxID=1340010 RepID=A0ABR4ARS1_9LECA
MYELCKVGKEELIGEVIRIEDSIVTIQVHEEIADVAVGDPVLRTGKPLSIELSPGLMEPICDGIWRSVKSIADKTPNIYSTLLVIGGP